MSMMVGGNRAGREGPAHYAVGSGFSERTDIKGFKAGEWPFLAVLIIKNNIGS